MRIQFLSSETIVVKGPSSYGSVIKEYNQIFPEKHPDSITKETLNELTDFARKVWKVGRAVGLAVPVYFPLHTEENPCGVLASFAPQSLGIPLAVTSKYEEIADGTVLNSEQSPKVDRRELGFVATSMGGDELFVPLRSSYRNRIPNNDWNELPSDRAFNTSRSLKILAEGAAVGTQEVVKAALAAIINQSYPLDPSSFISDFHRFLDNYDHGDHDESTAGFADYLKDRGKYIRR